MDTKTTDVDEIKELCDGSVKITDSAQIVGSLAKALEHAADQETEHHIRTALQHLVLEREEESDATL